MLRALNAGLAAAADENVLIVDCDRVAGAFGKAQWFDDRYWHLSKQAVALDGLPELARHSAAMLSAAEGLTAKCAVLDLDNTLWGGVIAEDGLAGIQLGDGPRGEAFVAFQEYLLALRARGVLLAVVSKNNEHDAREPFERHPDMRLGLSDISVFVANWSDKAANVKTVAQQLNIGLDSLVFIDDNPAERQIVRQLLPGVEVVQLPPEPAGYVRAVADTLFFETAAVTDEDLARAEQYRARATAVALAQQSGSLDEFYASLAMEALVAPFDELNLGRIVQLIGKTNQFNVTTRRHSRSDVVRFMNDPACVTLYLRLRDLFTDHGLVALLIARQDGEAIDIDTWLMSCRVIGRTVEKEMFKALCEIAVQRGCTRVRGTFIPTDKNDLVSDLFARLGFAPDESSDGRTTWNYNLSVDGIPNGGHIRVLAEPVASRA
jgi:FkbH-like protein